MFLFIVLVSYLYAFFNFILYKYNNVYMKFMNKID